MANEESKVEVLEPGQAPGDEPGEDKGGDEQMVLARHVLPRTLPIIPLRNRPLFPEMLAPLVIEEPHLKELIGQLIKSDSRYVGLVLIRKQDDIPANQTRRWTSKDLYRVGVVGLINQAAQASPEAPIQALIGAQERFTIKSVIQEQPHISAEVDYRLETDMSVNEQLKAYSLAVITAIKELIQINPMFKEEMNLMIGRSSVNEPGRLADMAASLTTAGAPQLQEILETFPVADRIQKVLVMLKKEIDITKLQTKISKQIEEKLSKQQREFFLREQLKEIKKELGLEKEGKETEIDRFKQRLKKLTLTDEAKQRIEEEMEKLSLIEPASPEFNLTRNYLDWLTVLPWGVFTKDTYDIRKARRVLDRDHAGLDDVKQRILEFLSVGIMKGNISGSIICFVGPPGVGKTSLGRSIAAAINRKFYRFSVGGMRDEAEIKGHRRTYIGALPGKFIQAMKVCQSANPVIMIDEIDKLAASFQGDPAAALLEVLDPEQNSDFLDHYLDVRFDLSNIFFITTANQLDTIPRPLLDRMEVIKLAGYILDEKLQIAKRFLIPRQLEAHGLQPKQLTISPAAIREMIDGYSREPGVRGLENNIKKVMRKSVKQLVEGKGKSIKVDVAQVPELLGKRVFLDGDPYQKPQPGVVTGLAWTSLGGETMHVEATRVHTGRASFKQTGQLGKVMVESSEIAYTYVRSLLDENAEAKELFDNSFVHLHVPAGATPKDGPSAGVSMATALYSLALNKPVKKDLAMTGEITLTGLVMPIGGVKEKTIAAKRARVKHLILPDRNRGEYEELPAHIRKGLKVHFVKTFEEIVELI